MRKWHLVAASIVACGCYRGSTGEVAAPTAPSREPRESSEPSEPHEGDARTAAKRFASGGHVYLFTATAAATEQRVWSVTS